MPYAPLPLQFAGYLVAGALCALVNVALFAALCKTVPVTVGAPLAFLSAAALNYWLCVLLLFRGPEESRRRIEVAFYATVVLGVCAVDLISTLALIRTGMEPVLSKAVASATVLCFNFLGRRFIVFPLKRPGAWQPSELPAAVVEPTTRDSTPTALLVAHAPRVGTADK
jgi:putative flippase GtrA